MEPDRRVRRIAIVGGGLAGWLAAATLARKLGGQCSIHVIDSPEVPAPGFGDATMPAVLELLRFLGLDQNDFIEKTQSTYCLGTHFSDWSAVGQAFWRPFGAFGALIERRPFFHYWHKARAAGLNPRIEYFNTEVAMAQMGRFIFPTNSLGVATHLRYSLHVDAGLVQRYLRTVAERAGVVRLERKLVSATRLPDGAIEELQFEDGGRLRADLYLDNTGARGQLIGETLGSPYESWGSLLPCDRIVHVPASLDDTRPPNVRITARPSGWSWRMPLQQNTSVGFVYSSAHQSDEAALGELMGTVVRPIGEARRQSFEPGCRRQPWVKNVVAIGGAAGHLEPLAGSNLHFASHGIFNLLDHFPDRQFDPATAASYNAGVAKDFEHVRDYVLMHYAVTRRDDSPFWRDAAARAYPDPLAQRLEMYRATGRIVSERLDLFSDLDWFFVLDGAGVVPRDYDPLVDLADFEQVKRLMHAISQKVVADVSAAPTHDSFFASANARLGNARRAAGGPAG